MEEEISRNIGAVVTEVGSPDLTNTYSDSNSVYQIYDIRAMTSRMVGSVKVALIPASDSTICATGQYISAERM